MGNNRKIMLCIIIVIMLLLQTTNCFAALTGIYCEIINDSGTSTTVWASVKSNVYSDLENANVTYALYKDGSAITDFVYSATTRYHINPDENGYETVYKYTLNKLDYSGARGSYSTITKAVYDGVSIYSDQLNIFSNAPVNGVTLNKLNLILKVGETEQLSAAVTINDSVGNNVTWTSSDNSVAIVSSSGQITAQRSGITKIRARSTENPAYYAECVVTVVNKRVYADDVHWSKATGPDMYINKVCYGNGVFLAVGKVILVSNDGVTWITVPGLIAEPTDIIWNGSMFVTVDAYGGITTSTDGVVWENIRSKGWYALHGIAWNGNIFVAVGDNGSVATSEDGISWTNTCSGISNNLIDVIWNGTEFIAIPGNGTIITSPDGKVWSTKIISTSTGAYTPVGMREIVWSGSKYVAAGEWGDIYTSYDGVNWTGGLIPNNSALFSPIWDGKEFIIVGQHGKMFKSQDGETWTLIESGTTETLTSTSLRNK